MILLITESNHWEKERWNYILDAEKQGAAVINDLLLFSRLCNYDTDRIQETAYADPEISWVTDMWGRKLYKLFAASHYWIKFFDHMDINERNHYPILINGRTKLCMNGGINNYKSGTADLSLCISSNRMYSAMLAMRDQKENKLYKNFDSLFLKKKSNKAKI